MVRVGDDESDTRKRTSRSSPCNDGPPGKKAKKMSPLALRALAALGTRTSRPSPSNEGPPGKKAKKLSPLALRALAALESEDDSSDSEDYQFREGGDVLSVTRAPETFGNLDENDDAASVGDEDDHASIATGGEMTNNIHKAHTSKDDPSKRTEDYQVETNAEDALTLPSYQSGSQSNDARIVSTCDRHNSQQEAGSDGQSSVDKSNAAAMEGRSGTFIGEDEEVGAQGDVVLITSGPEQNSNDARTITSTNDRQQPPATAVVEVARSNKSQEAVDTEINAAAGTDVSVIMLEGENEVFPHSATSEYSDVLSFFLSTPFDGRSMLSLHKLKEGIKLDKIPTPKGIQLPRDNISIVPQKKFIRNKKLKQSESVRGSDTLQANYLCHRDRSPIPSAAIDAEVASFLREEGRKLICSPLPLSDTSRPADETVNPATSARLATNDSHTCSLQNSPNHRVATDVTEMKLTSSNKAEVATLPVAFGFWPDKDDNSKKVAQLAAANWVKQGNTATTHNGKFDKGERSRSTLDGSKSNRGVTRRNVGSPRSEPAGPDFPEGWTIQTFNRNTRGNGSTYKVFIAPQKNARFRSKKSALIFVNILKEPGIDGERMALDAFKRREHKL